MHNSFDKAKFMLVTLVMAGDQWGSLKKTVLLGTYLVRKLARRESEHVDDMRTKEII